MEIITKTAWGSRVTNVTDQPGALPKVYIHHTAGHYPISRDEEVQQMHILQHIAIDTLHYGDIDYNWVIGPSGAIYEGRGLNKKSAATLDENDVSRSICLMGNYQTDIPTPPAVVAISDLIVALKRLNNLSQTCTILGHRDNPKHPLATACPGENLYRFIPNIREVVNNTPPPVGEDAMLKARFLRQKGFLNVFVVGNGYPVLDLSEELMTSLIAEDPTITKIFFDNMPAMQGLCHQAGLDIKDPAQVVPGGPTDRF